MTALRDAYALLHRRQAGLARAGLALAALLLLCLLAMAIDPRELRGVSVWVKPAKFAASLGLWCWSLAWAWAALDPAWRAGRAARVIVAGTIGFVALEAGWIALRAGLGLPSHFATDTVGAIAYGLMGLGALTGCLLAAAFGALVAWRPDRAMAAPLHGSVALGFLVAGLGGALTGVAISGQEGPYVGGMPSDAGAWPPFFWSQSGGDLRVAHFLAIHAMQALPLLGWVLMRAGAARPGAWVAAGSAAWVGLAGAAFAQALAGRPVL